MSDYFPIGAIAKPHGWKGDVFVYPSTDDPKRFELLETAEIYFQGNRPNRTLLIERVWYHKGMVMLKFKDVNDMTEAEKLKGGVIKIPPEQALPLGEDEYYIRDLLDMEVFTEEGEALGKIADIMLGMANDVYVVRDGDSEVLIPAVKEYIKKVDADARRMIVKLQEGLRG
jgi:16S rRNA processing protein RimM